MLKLEEETVQAEETAVVSLSLSSLEQVKEWLERDQKHLSKVHLQMLRHPGKSGGLNISFSFVPLRISSTSMPHYASNARGNFTWRFNKEEGQLQLI